MPAGSAAGVAATPRGYVGGRMASDADYQQATNVRRGLQRYDRHVAMVCRRHGLTPRQYVLLLMARARLREDGAATITALVDDLQLSQSTVTELAQRAESAGLVSRGRSDEDGRVTDVRPTPRGDELLAAVVQDLSAERATLLSALTVAREGLESPLRSAL
jgi:DNA-binding MarR family transcriptional regulator